MDQLTQVGLSWKGQKESLNAGGPGVPLYLKPLPALHLLHSCRFGTRVLLHSEWLERKTPGVRDILFMPVTDDYASFPGAVRETKGPR